MEKELDKKPLVELITEMSKLDKEIDILMLKYEKLRLEVVKRYPFVENDEVFKQKNKII